MISKFNPWGSIGKRIFITFTILLVSLTFVFTFIGLQFAENIIEEKSGNELRIISVALSRQVRRHLDRVEHSLISLKNDKLLLSELLKKHPNENNLSDFLRERLPLLPHIKSFAIFNRDGVPIAWTDNQWSQHSAKNRTFFIKGLQSYGLPTFRRPNGEFYQLASTPLTDGYTTLGVLVGELNIGILKELIDQNLNMSKQTTAFVLNDAFDFMASGSSVDNIPAENYKKFAANHWTGVASEFWVDSYKNVQGRSVMGTVFKLSLIDWHIVVERDLALILRPIHDIKRGAISVAALIVVLLVAITLILTRSITKPLRLLVQSTRRLSDGDFKNQIAVTGGVSEIVFLAAEIEKMRAKISAFQDQMLKRLEESEKKRRASERLATIGTLASTLAHEIRNPLNAMSLLLSRFELSKEPASPNQFVDLRGEIARLDRLVSKILDYARPLNIVWTKFSMHLLIRTVLDIYQDTLNVKGIKVWLDPEEESVIIGGDSDQLKQCFINLLQNSIDALGQGGNINIEIKQRDTFIEVWFRDDGPGMSSEAQERLFDLFFTTKENGTGLGLSIVKKIVEAHGGQVEIMPYQETGPGFTVKIILPINSQI